MAKSSLNPIEAIIATPSASACLAAVAAGGAGGSLKFASYQKESIRRLLKTPSARK